MKEAKEASRPPPRKISITPRRVGSGWESWSAVIHCAPCRRNHSGSGSPVLWADSPGSNRTHFLGTLHLAQPLRLEQLQAMSNDDCQIQSDFMPSRRISSKIREQRLPRQGDHFRFKQRRGGGEGEAVGRN